MGITAPELLAGPRGRRLCLELALELEELALAEPETDGGPAPARPIAAASRDVDRAYSPANAGIDYLVGFADDARVSRRALRLAQRAARAEVAALRANPAVTLAPLADALGAATATAASATGTSTEPTLETAALDAAIARSLGRVVDNAHSWPAPSGLDVALALPELREALRPTAALIAAAPIASWWDRPADPHTAWLALRDEDHLAGLARPEAADALWEAWKRGRHHAEAQGTRETWWSSPAQGELPRTHGVLPEAIAGLASAGLPTVALWEEESEGWDEGLETVALAVPERARVLELRSAEDWVTLCAAYPLPVTASFGLSAREAFGPDPVRGAGPWVIPDWSAVVKDYDAVHLTLAAYLSASGRLLPIGGLGATAVRGWDPDETFWLRTPELPDAAPHVRKWAQDDLGAWRATDA